ncbi:MAG: RNB domain-containing ribonuclease, partial [Alphaproteobacteria bacterium]|nr:RNB domain-containing ribonuclease [Alphaproteobacteria bacterium]
CSLKPNEDRLVLAVEAYVKPDGTVGQYRFMRGMIKSRARLTYAQVQNQIDTGLEPACVSLSKDIDHIYQVYLALDKARHLRGTLEISIPEYKVVFNSKGAPSKMVTHRERTSNKIIEEFMILANVCAAHALLKHKYPSVFRNHDEPDPKRYHNMIRIIKSFGYKTPKNADISPHTFNTILAENHKEDYQDFVQELVLRCQAQANYEVQNKGHFGLSLKYYTHFTSPIRRYSDLIVHRSLINALKLDNVSYTVPKGDDLARIAQHISQTERVAMNAERTAKERFAFAILVKDIGKTVTARISGIVERGFFVQIQGTCAEGFIPLTDLDDDYYTFDADNYRLIGRKKKRIYQLGQALQVKIITVNPMLSKLTLKIMG